jgi:hypothetical protein
MAGNTIAYIIEAKDKFSKTFEKLDKLAEKTSRSMQTMGAKMQSFAAKSHSIGKGITTYFTLPLIGAATYAAHAAESFDEMRVSFQAITGSATKAREMVSSVKSITTQMPISAQDVAKVMTRLTAAGLTGVDVKDTTKRISMMASAFKGDAGVIVQAYTRMMLAKKVDARNTRMWLSQNVPIVAEMKKIAIATGKYTSKDFDNALAKGKVNVSLLNQAMINLTNKGGKAFEVINDRLHTFDGAMTSINSSMKVYAADTFAAVMGSKTLGDGLGDLAKKLSDNQEKYAEFVKSNSNLIRIIVGAGGVLSALAAIGIIAPKIVTALALIFSPMGGFVIAAGALATAGIILYNKWKPFKDLMDDLGSSLKNIFTSGAGGFTTGITGAIKSGAKRGEALGTPLLQKFKHEITINVNDTNNVIKDMKVVSNNKDTKFNLGTNMPYSLGGIY